MKQAVSSSGAYPCTRDGNHSIQALTVSSCISPASPLTTSCIMLCFCLKLCNQPLDAMKLSFPGCFASNSASDCSRSRSGQTTPLVYGIIDILVPCTGRALSSCRGICFKGSDNRLLCLQNGLHLRSSTFKGVGNLPSSNPGILLWHTISFTLSPKDNIFFSAIFHLHFRLPGND